MRDATTRRPVRLAPTLVIATALVVGCGSPTPNPSGGQTPGPAPSGLESTAPSASPEPAPPLISLVGNPDADGWSHIAVGETPPVATLEPVRAGPAGVAPDTEFRLKALGGRDPVELARALVGEPPITFEVVSSTGDTATLRPQGGLVPGTTYRIALTQPDGSTEWAWAARAASPLAVADSVPGDAATRVPLDTAIEITFDQLGVTVDDFAARFSIVPAVSGRFEANGRSIAFLPDRPLARRTLYTVTLRRGLPLPGTGEILERDEVIRFETVGRTPSRTTVHFVRSIAEASTADRARITVAVSAPSRRAAPRSLEITVHRVPDLAAAVAAWEAIASAPEWTEVSTVEPVTTTGLEQVFAGPVTLTKLGDWSTQWFALPKRLPAGWYVVTERWAGIPRQVLLQVSDLATYALVARDRTAVWVNDVRTGKTVAGATASLAGESLGRTDKRGLLVASTPGAVTDGSSSGEAVLVVGHDGQATFRGTGIGAGGGDESAGSEDTGGSYEQDWGYGEWGYADDQWWRLFSTDRTIYRSTDTVNAWGMARDRDTGEAPASLLVRLRAGDDDSFATPLIASSRVTPDANGAFAIALSFRDLPDGDYTVDVVADGATIAEEWLEVGEIYKPAYQVEMSTDRKAVIAPDSVLATVRATFYEGTPAAGVRVDIDAYGDDDLGGFEGARVVTDLFGEGSHRVPLSAGPACQPCWAEIYATPHLPEEADLEVGTSVDVFAASAVVDAEATLSGTRLRLTGKVSDVDLERYEDAGPDEEVDFRGAGRAGARVHLRVEEHWSVDRQTGTRYDRITKKVVPVYTTDYKRRTVLDRSVTTGGNGTYALVLDVVGGKRSYEVTASYRDEEYRTTQTTAWSSEAEEEEEEDYEDESARLVNADSHTDPEEVYDGLYRAGDTVRVRFTGGSRTSKVQRYLYAITQQGLRYATVGDTPTFRTTFDESWLPGVFIKGVRFNGDGYEPAWAPYVAAADLASRTLAVSVTPDLERYQPGDTATVSIRTMGPDGPVSASVYVKAVDEKLYAIDAAYDTDPLAELYTMVGDGVLAEVRSHRAVEEDRSECCDTTGGGDGDDRSDFRDWLVATLVTTDQRGRATLQVPLSDDLTSWRVVATAVDGSLRAGQGSGTVAVSLPFFAEATLKSEYLAADRPVLTVRGFGTALRSSDRITFTVSSDTLPMAAVTVKAPAFGSAEVHLPRLTVGEHRVRIEADAGGGRSDVLVRTFRVVDSRAVRRATTWSQLEEATAVDAGAGRSFTYLTLVDAGRGRVVPTLQGLTWTDGVRSDQQLAARLAERILAGEFGMEPEPGAEAGLGAFERRNGLALVAHGSAQLEVTALAAMADDPWLSAAWLRDVLEAVAFDEGRPRERRLLALAGLAGLGEPVLDTVRKAAAQPDLGPVDQITVALAALYAGDEAVAGRLERAVLAGHGRARGPLLRLDTGDAESDALQTARLAIVSASLGRPYAADMDAWLEANPPRTTVVDLERALAARGWVERVAGGSAVAALWVDGSRRELAIRAGDPVSIQLTPAQAATARVEPVSGSVIAVTQRELPLDPGGLTVPDGVTITRTVKPAGDIRPTDTVIVTLTVRLPPAARAETWTVTDWAPSGLTPTGHGGGRSVGPDAITGQRVEFSLGGNRKQGTWTLRYAARVVTSGRYRWEPAILQSDLDPDEGVTVRQDEIVILDQAASAAARPTPTPAPSPQPTPEPSALPAPTPTPTPVPQPTATPLQEPEPGPTGSPPPTTPRPSPPQSPSP